LTFLFPLFMLVGIMKVLLAGYNVDKEVLEELKKSAPQREDVTPETLSASYARISRDPRPIDELRRIARAEVERARRSNRNIIFKMGHHSVAEHAVFNFDIIGVSRLVIEEIEKYRLCSYTEKSQRYITLKGDFVLPEEVKKAGKQDVFVKTIQEQNMLYHKLYKKLRSYVFEKHKELAEMPKKHSILDGWAKEDARYVVSSATKGQLGMTINARNLELLIRRFASQKLSELKELNLKIYELAKEVAPSIILFTEENDFDAKTYDDLRKHTELILNSPRQQRGNFVQLVDYTPDGDTKLIAVLMHSLSSLSFKECLARAKTLKPEEKLEFIKSACKHMEFYDVVLREWEYVDFTFDIVVSACCFAQLKRHRMATLTTQKYDPELGVTIPPSIKDIGGEKDFIKVMDKTNRVYLQLKECMDQGAEYILTNAHRKRVLLKVNARELYHISRLREDTTAQWDIRDISRQMRELAQKVMPLTCLLACGKDAYPQVYKDVFGENPKFFPPEF